VDLTDSEHDTITGSCEYSNEPSGSAKENEFLDPIRDYELFNKDSARLSLFSFV
jgi:hypothetical protein